ncbi:RidA family protein [Subtercola frigoramans]|uniref:Reactive intermediate/imine deaminase n=1 Tax=Subtercola frigoramans TaxID=120298 RepID=A0ABS2L9L9_9MICO|nr:Rid family hydrolase [Subtercola frigoramans]MBM7473674.1 reactive intermediate/imine deaminase [Subtercola frigoramans]
MPTPAPLSPSRTVGDLVFLSGVVPRDATGLPSTGDVAEQTHTVLRTLSGVLEAAGSSLADVCRVGVYLSDLDEDFEAFNAVYVQYFTAPFPARTTIGARPRGVRVEIDAIAVRHG